MQKIMQSSCKKILYELCRGHSQANFPNLDGFEAQANWRRSVVFIVNLESRSVSAETSFSSIREGIISKLSCSVTMPVPHGATNLNNSGFGHLPLIYACQGLDIFLPGYSSVW